MKSRIATRNGMLLPALLAAATLTQVHAASPRDTAIADHALAYYELGVNGDPRRSTAVNYGSLGTEADGLHFPGVTQQVAGAIAGTAGKAIHFHAIDTNSNDSGYPTVIPWTGGMQTVDFSAEAWVRPTIQGPGNNGVIFRNHTDSGDRTGWVLWEGTTGWNLRMYNGNGSSRAIDITTPAYTVGQWVHLAVTFNHTTRTAVIYVNGQQAATGTFASGIADYVPLNFSIDPSVGGFANGRDNPFTGDIDEVAYYNKTLTAARVLAHYQNGVDANRTTSYEATVAQDAPVGYYHMDEAPVAQVTNYGSLGASAVGTLVNAPDVVAGPSAPTYPGFPTGAGANLFNGSNTYLELNNPDGLAGSTPMTLEAWVQPGSTHGNSEVILGHGGDANFNEVFLRMEAGNYEAGDSISGGASGKASFAVPAEDLGTTGWVHLAATCSGGQWILYRNGQQVATGPSALTTGVEPVPYANWGIGARGRYKNSPALGTYPVGPVDAQRVFNGSIAAAGIYGSALTATQVLAHYNAGAQTVTPLSNLVITQSGANAILTWTSGTLSQSDDLINWSDVAGATSPYTVPATGKKFFRLHD